MDQLGFEQIAGMPAPPLDALVLALAAEFGDVAWGPAVDRLDQLGLEVAYCLSDKPRAPHREAAACRIVLAERHGFAGDTIAYADPCNSMLDSVLERGSGLPITLSVLWIEVARRAGVTLAGVGLPGHFVVGHFGVDPPLLIDPFRGGALVEDEPGPVGLVRAWSPHDIALRMLNNLVRSYGERGDLARALHAAELRSLLPSHDEVREQHAVERASLLARLN
jgi:regulator of sirC expression with transglutaminase-like and TPR domain